MGALPQAMIEWDYGPPAKNMPNTIGFQPEFFHTIFNYIL